MSTTAQLSKTFSALGDKTRLRLFQLLAEQSQICVSQLAETLEITPACVSQHMKILTEVELVTRVRSGQRVCYQINADSPQNVALNRLIFQK